MDLFRRLRSHKGLSAAVPEKGKNDDRPVGQLVNASDREKEEDGGQLKDILLHDADKDEGDLFEDATAALGQQQLQQQEQERQDQLDQKEKAANGSRVHVSDELVEDHSGGDREEEEDGRASHGSGESFDSAVDRIASSEASYDTTLSPESSSLINSLRQDPVEIGNSPSLLSDSQKAALLWLNRWTTGNLSLDTSLIDDSSTGEEFKSRASKLVESRGQIANDSFFATVVDPLLPLVVGKSDRGIDSDDKAPEGEGEDAHSVEASESIDDMSKLPQSPAPEAQLAVTDESDRDEFRLSEDEGNAKNDNLDNGGEKDETAEVNTKPEILEREGIESNSVPDSNEGHDGGSGNLAAMAIATPSTEEMEEPVEDTTVEPTLDVNLPSKISASQSELGGDVSLVHPNHESTEPEREGNSKNDEDSFPAKVSPEEAAEIQLGPVAKTSDEDVLSPVNHLGEVSARSDTPQVASEEIPADRSMDTGVLDGSLEGVSKDETEVLGQVSTQSTGEKAANGEEAFKIPFCENGAAEIETVMANLDDREEIDGEYEEDEDNDDNEDNEDNEEENEDENGYLERSEALAALLRSADSSAGTGAVPSLGSAGPSLPARPTRTVRPSLPSLEPASRAAQQARNSQTIRSSNLAEETQANGEPDGNEETREKLQSIRVKFLRLALRLGQSAHNVVVAQVLYRLGLAEQLRGGRGNRPNTAFSYDRASSIAEEQERAGIEELDFACTIMMLGKTGVGKSATLNSIFDEAKTGTNAFIPSTNEVQVITGHVHGIKVRVIDTPGLLPSVVDQRHNEKIMASVKRFIQKQSPDIVLYFDRLDMQSRDYGDLPLLRTITDTFGAAVWFNAIVVFTHASSAPPDGPNGLPLSYEMFVAQRSHVVQQTIRQAAGDMRLMNPVSLVENHIACRVNRSGDKVLPNGQVWKPQLLLLCFASKILAEANSLLKLQDNIPGRPFGQKSRVPPLPFLLSSLLQSRALLKLPDEQIGEDDESDEELEEDGDSEDEDDYDQLPTFRRLAKEEIAELDEINRGQYFEELAERERLFQKKQWKEELKRRKETKERMGDKSVDQPQFGDEGLEEDMAKAAAVPVPMLDMVLPLSFDSDNPSHRYRYLETANQWLVRPVLETHGWDHDNGYDGMSVEKVFVIGDRTPTSVSGQITKDKKEASLNMEAAASLRHGEGKVTLAGLDVQTVGKDLAYTIRSETRFNNLKGNKTTGGLAVTRLGDTFSMGMKIEDRLLVGKRLKLVVNGGAISGAGDVAYGGSLEATLRDKEYPFSRSLSTLGVSIMDWHGDLAVGGNWQSQLVVGKTMMVGRANVNNRGAGQISIRASSSEQLQMALIGILPIVRAIANRLFGQPQQ